MKILVFSDSHTDVETMIKVAEYEKPNAICHCGDHLNDALELAKQINVPLYCVAGNTDTAEADLYEKYVEIGGKRFLLIHGHQYGIGEKDNYWDGLKKMFFHRDDVDIVLFGHTHEPFIYRCNARWLFNPGSVKARLSNYINASSYGLININKDTDNIRFEIVQTPNNLLCK